MSEAKQENVEQPAASYPEAAASLLGELLQRMGYELDVQPTEQSEHLLLELSGEGADELTAQKGQALDALQFIVNRILTRDFRHLPGVVVDAGGYRARRTEALKQMAEELSHKASSLGKVLAINPMNAHDRRVVHMALRDDPSVTTESEGDGDQRRVLIVPRPA